MARRKNKKLSNEDLEELEGFLNRSNVEERKLFELIKINVKHRSRNQKKLTESIRKNEITIVSGLPGTGKTFLACAEALRAIKNTVKYKRIVLIKSITPLKDEEIGHLPGNLKEKLAPIMESFFDNFRKLIGKSRMEKMIELGLIEIVPIAFARGRSIDHSIILIDEAQNITMNNIRTLMTRIGDNSKMVIMGDIKQRDIKRDSSLEIIIKKFDELEGFGCVELRDPEDVVRNPIIKTIENVFDSLEDNK